MTDIFAHISVILSTNQPDSPLYIKQADRSLRSLSAWSLP